MFSASTFPHFPGQKIGPVPRGQSYGKQTSALHRVAVHKLAAARVDPHHSLLLRLGSQAQRDSHAGLETQQYIFVILLLLSQLVFSDFW